MPVRVGRELKLPSRGADVFQIYGRIIRILVERSHPIQALLQALQPLHVGQARPAQ